MKDRLPPFDLMGFGCLFLWLRNLAGPARRATRGETAFAIAFFIFSCLVFILSCVRVAVGAPPRTFATWYSVASCEKEGTSGITASGEPLDDDAFTCATWQYPFGTLLRVTYRDKSVIVKVNDRGPGRKARRRGVIIDLTKRAFLRLSPLEAGSIAVQVEEGP